MLIPPCKPANLLRFREDWLGGDLVTLQKILGHSDLRLLQRYVHLAERHRLETARAVGRSMSDRLSTVRAQSVGLEAGPSA